MTILAVLISAFVVEEGPRMTHGNFVWQNVVCTYLLFLSTIAYLTPKILDIKSWVLKDKIMITLLTLHGFSGIVYLIKIGLTKSYH